MGNIMFAGFANGSVASYVMENESVRPISKLNVGSAVRLEGYSNVPVRHF